MSLLLRLPDGTDDDWRTFWGIYGPMVLGVALRSGLCSADAEDVLALVMRKLMGMLKAGFEVDHRKGRFRNLVATLTRREVVGHYRRTRRSAEPVEAAGEVEATGRTPVEEFARLERISRLNLCLDQLRTDRRIRRRDWMAFERYALCEEPAARVARDLDLTPARVHDIKHDMLKRMQKLMLRLEVELGEV